MEIPVPLLRDAAQMVSDVLVLGGGLAGAGAAAILARSGRDVQLLERETGPHHKVCGEFLSIEAQRDLERIGIDVMALGAVPIGRVRLISGEREIEARLPFTAAGISRKLLDEKLLELAEQAGAQINRGVRITGLSDGAVSTSQSELCAGTILLATGKHDIRGGRRLEAGESAPYVGFKMHYRANAATRAALTDYIDLVIFDGGYAGLQLVSPEVMNLCLIVHREHLADVGGDWQALLSSLMREAGLARRLDNAEPLFAKPLAISNLPYGYACKPDKHAPPGLYRLGDQAAMTASLTGDGMAIALRSAVIASTALLAGEPAFAYHQRIDRAVSSQLRRAMMLQGLAENARLLALGLPILARWPQLLAKAAAMTRLPGN